MVYFTSNKSFDNALIVTFPSLINLLPGSGWELLIFKSSAIMVAKSLIRVHWLIRMQTNLTTFTAKMCSYNIASLL